MSSPQIVFVFRCLVRETFRQAVASKIFWVLLAISGLCILFCLSVSIEGGDNLRPDGDYLYHGDSPMVGPSLEAGRLGFLFGAFRVSLARDREGAVHFLQVILGNWAGGALGLLLTLIWTAGFVPEFLQPNNASVLLSKPIPRWLFLVGKYVGVLAFVALQAGIFFGGTWMALGLKTGIWSDAYLAGILILVFHFGVVFSFSLLLAVMTRSTVACVLGSISFWAACVGMNYGRHAVMALPQLGSGTHALSSFTLLVADIGYWILPKPLDYLMLLERALDASAHMATLSKLPEFQAVGSPGAGNLLGLIASSLLFVVASLVVASRQLSKTDY
jgi:ABC-type transport system involved in multi-copper enzyme maturation permease subunit